MNDQFNLFEGERRKEEGISRAVDKRADDLKIAQAIARKIAMQHPDRECHADLVQWELMDLGINLGNAAGSIFRGTDWEFTGRWVKSIRVTNHASVRRVWRLK